MSDWRDGHFSPIEGGDGHHRIGWMVAAGDGWYELKRFDELTPEDDPFGIEERHRDPSGNSCGGRVQWRPFSIMEGSGHQLVSREPLTIEASIGCRTCPAHGWIRDGKWVDA